MCDIDPAGKKLHHYAKKTPNEFMDSIGIFDNVQIRTASFKRSEIRYEGRVYVKEDHVLAMF